MASFRESFSALLTGISSLPTLPEVLWELEAAFHNPLMGLSEVADIIGEDASLTATVLKVSNSAHYRGRNEFVSIRDAVVRLGLSETRRLTKTALFVNAFAPGAKTLDYADFWRHSFLVGVAAKYVQDQVPRVSPLLSEEAYLSGLLHDVGKLVLDQHFETEFQQIRQVAADRACPDAEAERIVIDVDHGDVGAELLELWGLPDSVINAVRWHHATDQAPEDAKSSAQLIEWADYFVHLTMDVRKTHVAEVATPRPITERILDGLKDRLVEEEKLSPILAGR